MGTANEIGRIKFLSVSDQSMLPKSHSCLGRKRLGRPRQVPRHWQASLRQDLHHVVTGSVLGFPSASLLVLRQLECPVSFFGAARTSALAYKADPGHFRHCPFWSPFTTRSSVRGWVFYFPPIPGENPHYIYIDCTYQAGAPYFEIFRLRFCSFCRSRRTALWRRAHYAKWLRTKKRRTSSSAGCVIALHMEVNSSHVDVLSTAACIV
jgi:hypothetical protein